MGGQASAAPFLTKLPHRSGATWLTDDDLLLLDFLFDKRAESGFLRASRYPLHMNCRHTHSLSDSSLIARLVELEAAGVVVSSIGYLGDGDIAYELTPHGLGLWEEERQPDWSRYIEDGYSFLNSCRDRLEIASILAYDRAVAEAFLSSATRHGMWSLAEPLDRVRWCRFSSTRLIPVRGSRTIYTASFWIHVADRPPGRAPDWRAMAGEATWWRTVGEWDTLRLRLSPKEA